MAKPKPVDVEAVVARYLQAIKTAESPIESDLHMALQRFLHPEATLQAQRWLDTKYGRFRCDLFLTTAYDEQIIIECDGREFHDGLRDSFRDAFILESHCANFIYRFTGQSITRRVYHCLYGLYRFHPGVFDPQADPELIDKFQSFAVPGTLGQDRFKGPRILCRPESFYVSNNDGFANIMPSSTVITIRAGRNERRCPLYGREIIEFARKNPGQGIDELVGAVRQEQERREQREREIRKRMQRSFCNEEDFF